MATETAFVPGFKYDIFLSYAQANNKDGAWVTNFRQKLGLLIAERLENGPVFFRDTESLQGNDDLTEEIVTGIRSTAILVAIISHKYITRPWCQKECEQFMSACRERGIRGRIFPVRYDDISFEKYQKYVGEKIGYPFFAALPDSNKYFETLKSDSDAFRVQINKLRTDIVEKLEEMKVAAVSPPLASGPGPVVSTPSLPRIFLADPAPALRGQADQLASHLKSLQVEVVRPEEGFSSRNGYAEHYATELGSCLAYVQLLGRSFNAHPDEEVQSWDRWQFRQAQQAGRPVLGWFNKFDKDGKEIDLQKLDEDHLAFVRSAGFWDCELQRFRELIAAEVKRLAEAARQQERAGDAEPSLPLVVLRTSTADRTSANEIGQELQKYDCNAMVIPDGKTVTLEELAASGADGLLVVNGTCPPDWALARLQDLRNFLSRYRGKRWTYGMWKAPDQAAVFMKGMIVIDPGNPQTLKDFVARLRQQAAETGAAR